MNNENTIRKTFLVLAMLMSVTLLYGGYQVRQEADKKSQYEKTIRERAEQVNARVCEEINSNGEAYKASENPVRFLRVCAEEL